MKTIKINHTKVGIQYEPYYIADIAANHDGDLNRAFKLIELAKMAGADAAKFQNFKAAKIVSKKAFDSMQSLSHQANWQKSVFEVYQDAAIPDDWSSLLKSKCDEVGIEYMTSPYDIQSVDHADKYVNCFKIGSGDITWLGIIEHMASKNKPILLATGASAMVDVERAMKVLQGKEIVLMQCNTNYTASQENFKYINLNVLKSYHKKWQDVVLGISDHTKGISTVLASIALGSRVIEKHFTDDCTRSGPDHAFSTTPIEWREMVDRCKECFYALGDGIKKIEVNEIQTAKIQRRSIYAKKDIEKGSIITLDDVEVLRPHNEKGFAPYEIKDMVGKAAQSSISKGSLIVKGEM